MHCIASIVKGSRISVRGIPDVARHADVTVTECRDLDNSRFPMGLVCAAEPGNLQQCFAVFFITDCREGFVSRRLRGPSHSHSFQLYSWEILLDRDSELWYWLC